MPRLSLAKLERHLYSAADRLRQEGLDAATYKDYIFGMLFLKRCSDVFDAEYERIVRDKIERGMTPAAAKTEYGEDPDYYDGFFVPDRARWQYLQDKLNDGTVCLSTKLTRRDTKIKINFCNLFTMISFVSASCSFVDKTVLFLCSKISIISHVLRVW